MTMTKEVKAQRLEARRKARSWAKIIARIEEERNQPHVKQLTITIEWKKSRMWGQNPHATAQVIFWPTTDDKYGSSKHKEGYTCGGSGYDKSSTVIASVFNDFLKYKLWDIPRENLKGGNGGRIFENRGPCPYGISSWTLDSGEEDRRFAGGVGTNCYTAISEFIGGKFETISSGKTFDVYRYTDNEENAPCQTAKQKAEG